MFQSRSRCRRVHLWFFLGNSLITLTFHLLNQYGLVELFQLDMIKLWRFLVLVQEDYHSDNPYHNAVHAADVTQAMYCFLQEPMVRSPKQEVPFDVIRKIIVSFNSRVFLLWL